MTAALTKDQLDEIRKCAIFGLSMEKAARKAGVSLSQLETGPGAEAYYDGLIDAEYNAGQMLLVKAREGDATCLRQYIDRILKAEPEVGDPGSNNRDKGN